MRSFLLRLLRFTLLAAVFAIGFRFINRTLVALPIQMTGDQTEVLVVGDSHITYGIAPDLLPNAWNIAQPAEPLVASYYKTMRLLPSLGASLHTVVIGFGLHNLSEYHDTKFMTQPTASEMLSRYYEVLDPTSVPGLSVNRRALLVARARDIWTPNVHLMGDGLHRLLGRDRAQHPFIGGYDVSPGQQLLDEELAAALERHFGTTGNQRGISVLQAQYLERLLSNLTGAGLRVILIATPTHPRYRSGTPATFASAYQSTCAIVTQNQLVQCLDLTTVFSEDRYFSDWHHLSRLGAEATTHMLAEVLLSSGSVRPQDSR